MRVSGDYACVSIFDNGRVWPIRSNRPNPSSFRRSVGENVDQRLHLSILAQKPIIWIDSRPASYTENHSLFAYPSNIRTFIEAESLASQYFWIVESRTQWLNGLYYADLISFLQPYSTVRGGGATKSRSNELPISVPLSLLSKEFQLFLVKSDAESSNLW